MLRNTKSLKIQVLHSAFGLFHLDVNLVINMFFFFFNKMLCMIFVIQNYFQLRMHDIICKVSGDISKEITNLK